MLYVHLNEPKSTENPHFFVFVFMLHVLKAIQKEKSNVAIKFAGTFMIYISLFFSCVTMIRRNGLVTVCVLELQTPKLKTPNSNENWKRIKSH